MSSKGWKKYKLEDIAEIVGGGTPSTANSDYWGGEIPWLTPRDLSINQNRFVCHGERNITKLGLENSSAKLLPAGSILLTSRAPIGYLAIASNPICTNQGFKSLIPNTQIVDGLFLYYLLRNNVDYLKSVGVGTTFAEISGGVLRQLEFDFPDLPTQRQIAETLSALDDKIELNRQTNATLEAIAQAIFKEWFVDVRYPGATGEMVDSELGPIPRGWRVGILSEVLSSIESGSRPKGGVGDLAEGIPSIGAENINGLGFYDFSKEKFVSEEFFAKLKSGIVKSEDVLLYKDGASLGRKTMFMDGFPHQICAINEHVFILRSNNLINQLFLYFWLDQSYMTENIKSLNSNSAQPGINQPAVRSLPILIPEKTISEKFEQIVKPLLSKLFNDCKESYSLSLLRDKLLPKLMSGEIQI